MERKYEVNAPQTVETLNRVLDMGITNVGILIRHSDRFYTRTPNQEPFMGLTQAGKTYAQDLGKSLNGSPAPSLNSSFFGRCIETAYLIDKGYTQTHNAQLDHNQTHETLAPFYIKDIERSLTMLKKQGTKLFLRNWFDRKIDTALMEDPEKSADRLCEFMIDQIQNLKENTISVCVSHDWNIFPIKEFKMGMQHETSGDVGYLDGLVFYEDQGKFYVVNYQSDPVCID